ncbi:hypothetical protein SAMN05216326_13216 [Nitrosomonas marina]|uniref:Gp5/Type VI secretion system Vgr protein OB-fold domain-containing protein n=1 Tax=Nitrosomonas marina TaxID=917 RepID=A0A1I0F1L1_9PROT|nr:phage baseplate assembly protein V [Nitrosomonas marina]SET51670.1 hypothetical protein SAMN05216326_13216 [Nitrosomonas marina]
MNLEQTVASIMQKMERQFYGKYRGFVVENEDPEQLGRLRVRVPSVLGNDVVTGWALPCLPFGGNVNQGMFFIPEVDAGVWIEFEEGDLECPIWAGTFWSKPGGESEIPKTNGADGTEQDIQKQPTRKIIKTLKGHSIQIEDKDDEEMILINEAINGHVIKLDKEGVIITDGANGNAMIMDKDGTIIEDANGNKVIMEGSSITVEESSGNKIILESGGIKVGSDGASEPFLLGNTFLSNFSSLVNTLATHTHLGNMGAPTSPPTSPIMFVEAGVKSMKHKVE